MICIMEMELRMHSMTTRMYSLSPFIKIPIFQQILALPMRMKLEDKEQREA